MSRFRPLIVAPPVADAAPRGIDARFAASATTGPAYQPGGANRCPHCGGGAFHVGRVTAECGACGNPLALAPARTVITTQLAASARAGGKPLLKGS